MQPNLIANCFARKSISRQRRKGTSAPVDPLLNGRGQCLRNAPPFRRPCL